VPYQDQENAASVNLDHLRSRMLYKERLPLEPYALVRRQLLGFVRVINKKREQARKELLPYTCIQTRRTPVKPFGEAETVISQAA
jgi:hypothetical protein